MQRFKLGIIALALLLLTAGSAFAAGDGDHPLPWMNLFYRILNIALFVGVIYFFFGKKIDGFFKNRTRSIAEEISTMEQRKVEAQQRLSDVEQRIADLDKEREAILAAYRQQGEMLGAEIVAQAEKNAQMITEQSKHAAQNEVSQAIESLRAQMADEIIAAAEKTLSKKMTPAEQAKLVDKYLTRVVLN